MKYLQSMKLADRMAVHALDYVVKKKDWGSDQYLEIVIAMRQPHNKIEEEYIQPMPIPELVKEKIHRWMNYRLLIQ